MRSNVSHRCKPDARERCSFEIHSHTDAIVAGYVVRAFAIRNGLMRRAASELAIVGAELASNVVRHGGGHGVLHIRSRDHDGRSGIELLAEDEGPGLGSQRRGFGRGLGQGIHAARRLVDELELRQNNPRGLSVWAFKAAAQLIMSDTETKVLAVLQRYASGPTARGMMRKAKAEVDLSATVPAERLPRLRRALASGIRLFIDESFRERVTTDLLRLEGKRDLPPPVTIPIKNEHDARRARMLTRSMCADVGAAPLTALKAATGLSELTRNILNYAGEGSVYIAIDVGPPRTIRIEAIDTGPGISNLDLVLSGRYRSRTGLGKGLLGTQRIATRFDIHTDSTGTRVEFEVTL